MGKKHSFKGRNNPMYGKKHTGETIFRLSVMRLGKNNPAYGKKGKNAPNYKDGTSLKIHRCKCGHTVSYSTFLRGGKCKSCENRRRVKLGINNVGRKGILNYNYRHGKSNLSSSIRGLQQYKEWVFRVFSKDNFTCQYCNKHGCYLEAHHIITFIFLLLRYNISSVKKALKCKQLWDINNGITLCTKCYKLVHKIKSKNGEVR